MRNIIIAATFIVSSLFGSNLFASACTADGSNLQDKISEVQDAYTKKFKRRAEQVKRETDELTDDAPDPNAVEATLDIEIETTWDITEMKLHVPEFRMEDKRIVFHLPKIEMKRQEWIYHTPSVIMKQQCINKPPETVCWTGEQCVGGGWSKVCVDVPQCKLRGGGQMCTDIPEVFMQEQRTVLHVPETRMEKNEIIIGLPVTEMKLQTWKIHLPQFTVKSISGEIREIEEKADEIQRREKNASKVLSDAMKGEITEVSLDGTKSLFDCQISSLGVQKETALNDLDTNIAAVKSALSNAQSIGATDFAKSMSETLNQLVNSRSSAVESFEKALVQMNEQKSKTIEKLLNPEA